MKTKRVMLPLLIALILPFLLFSFTGGILGNASEEEEIDILIETATTPGDHIRLADYYEKEAAKMEEKGYTHASKADAYETRLKPLTEDFQQDQKRMYTKLAIHCSDLSKSYREAAQEYRIMAMVHRKMAEQKN